MAPRKILITGATGKQGGAVIKALLDNPPPFEYQILALTRKKSSPVAQSLGSNPQITLVEGSLDEPGAIFTKAGGDESIWGVFLMTMPSFKKDQGTLETTQGNAMVDAAIAHHVKHLVYTSVDRGGPGQSDLDATEVPHFVTKFNVEKYLREKFEGHTSTYTILRPVAFMENLTPNFGGRMFAAMWNNMGAKPLQLISTKDIGVFAAQALAGSEKAEYQNTCLSLAGDDLTQTQANEVFWKVLGRPMPRSYGFMATLLQKAIPELGTMFRWFTNRGYGADIGHDRQLHKGLLDFEAWLREESGFKR